MKNYLLFQSLVEWNCTQTYYTDEKVVESFLLPSKVFQAQHNESRNSDEEP